ncbi:hypothetical protein BJ878DRAFT_545950 [Calycina marina]|uniref:Uncharacterized protein n=1 Tax=Calycina marina TaxID=1763456 RepID=A0A9P7YWU9_9HELO|nr:hypothetical protein BJ878DRAFT_545950 [Calycina marina]
MPMSLPVESLGKVFTIDINYTMTQQPICEAGFEFPPTRMDLAKTFHQVPFHGRSLVHREPDQDSAKGVLASYFKRRPLELSCPSMITDSFLSISENFPDEISADLTSTDGWDSYFGPTTSNNPRPPSFCLHLATRPQIHGQTSYEKCNIAFCDLSKLSIDSPSEASLVQKNSHDSSPSHPRPRTHRSQTQVSSPTAPPSAPQYHISWQSEPEKRVFRPGRPRANTTPSRPPATSKSTCITPNFHQSSDPSPLHIKNTHTPSFAPMLPALPPLYLANEKSYFDFDDDEESPRAKLARVLRIHGRANTAGVATPDRDGKGSVSDSPKRKFRKRMSNANQTIKGVLGIKK